MDDRNITIHEECLLAKRHHTQNAPKRKTDAVLKGPLRVFRLCALGILLPCSIVALILFMRYKVYVEQMYPLAVSDMRMLDNRISTTWCQRQLIRTNATFNAFLLSEAPQIAYKHKTFTMVRHLELEDDTKEYWGFYLLRGSVVTLSSCVRWPGASLIVIRGHKHLHECAYIGDNSSEELDELMESIREGEYKFTNDTEEDDAPSNTPHLMRRHRPDVQFHQPAQTSHNHSLDNENHEQNTDITDAKQFKKLLESLTAKTGKKAQVADKKHVHRNSKIGDGEQDNIKFDKDDDDDDVGMTKPSVSDEVLSSVMTKLQSLGDRGEKLLQRLNEKFSNRDVENVINIRGRQYLKPSVQFDDNIDAATKRRKRELILHGSLGEHVEEENNVGGEEDFKPDGIADHHEKLNETQLNDKSNSEFWSSFSSSEESLLNCEGLILNLPLTPHTKCHKNLSEHDIESAYLPNRITYKVPTNGYYFFVFNSENEVQTNYIRVHFNIEKAIYNVSNAVAQCANSSQQCAMDLRFFSDEKLVMELPITDDDHLFNEEYVVVSVCEPRTSVYVICVISVPILVILFAFQ